MEIDFIVDEDCKHCKKSLKYLKKLYKRNKKAYGSFILFPIKRLLKRGRDLGEEDRIKGVLLRPDYNSLGHLTHFHISKEKENVIEFAEEIIKEIDKKIVPSGINMVESAGLPINPYELKDFINRRLEEWKEMK